MLTLKVTFRYQIKTRWFPAEQVILHKSTSFQTTISPFTVQFLTQAELYTVSTTVCTRGVWLCFILGLVQRHRNFPRVRSSTEMLISNNSNFWWSFWLRGPFYLVTVTESYFSLWQQSYIKYSCTFWITDTESWRAGGLLERIDCRYHFSRHMTTPSVPLCCQQLSLGTWRGRAC